MDLTETEDVKNRWQKYTEEPYKKDLNDSDNNDGVITHLEPDILDNEVKRALGNITMNKTNRLNGIPAELFQILISNPDVVKVLHSIYQQIWKTQQWPEDRKRSVFIPIPKRQCQRMFKLTHNCSCVQLFEIPWTATCQAPLSVGFPRQEYWSGLPFPSPSDFLNTVLESGSPIFQVDSLPTEPPGKPDSSIIDSCRVLSQWNSGALWCQSVYIVCNEKSERVKLENNLIFLLESIQ